ncbi:hypothetical protein HK104_007853, partial [Borealophlyctis nickersoniae]
AIKELESFWALSPTHTPLHHTPSVSSFSSLDPGPQSEWAKSLCQEAAGEGAGVEEVPEGLRQLYVDLVVRGDVGLDELAERYRIDEEEGDSESLYGDYDAVYEDDGVWYAENEEEYHSDGDGTLIIHGSDVAFNATTPLWR